MSFSDPRSHAHATHTYTSESKSGEQDVLQQANSTTTLQGGNVISNFMSILVFDFSFY
jgi:hypothetical protein